MHLWFNVFPMRNTPQLLPPTINLHLIRACNYKCRYCYAAFLDNDRGSIPQAELRQILELIASAPRLLGMPPRKVTFVGGEPLLYKTILDDIAYARSLGLVTSLVTNASRLSPETVRALAPVLDWLTVSIDSLVPETNLIIGRSQGRQTLSASRYAKVLELAKSLGIKVKINTVVNMANLAEDFSGFIEEVRPVRWKLFQVTRIEGQNDSGFDQWGITVPQFEGFVNRHRLLEAKGIILVPETQAQIYGSYAMVSPSGSFFDNSSGTYRYSRKIVEVGVEAAFAEINFSYDTFAEREGDYDSATGLNKERSLIS